MESWISRTTDFEFERLQDVKATLRIIVKQGTKRVFIAFLFSKHSRLKLTLKMRSSGFFDMLNKRILNINPSIAVLMCSLSKILFIRTSQW